MVIKIRQNLTLQQSNILSANIKKVAWLFDVTLPGHSSVDYHWSTQSERLDSNLITNYDNESSVMTPVTAGRGTLAQSSEQKYAGSYSAKYVASATVGAHYTYTLTTLGTMHKVSIWVYLPSGQATTSVGLWTLLGPANQEIAFTTLTDQWVLLTGYVTTTASAIGIIGNASSCSGDCWYEDNFSITEVLNPALAGYSYKIMDFSPITLNMGSPESGVIPPTKTTIRVSFPDSVIDGLYASDFKGASVTVRLVCGAYLEPIPAPEDTDEIVATPDYQECEIMAWRFKVLSSSAVNQIMTWECQDFFTLYLEGDYPNTPLVSDLFRADIMKADNVCVPLAFGQPFMPVRWIPFNQAVLYVDADTFTIAGDKTALFSVGQHLIAFCGVDGSKSCWVSTSSFGAGVTTVNLTAASDDLTANLATVQTDHYLLGASGPTYTIDRARTPIEQSGKTTYYDEDIYTGVQPIVYKFKQDTVTGSDSVSYRVVQNICDDANKDGTNDANGVWGIWGKEMYDMPLRFSRSDLATMTSPPNIAEYIWEAWGIPSAEIDAVSHAAAVATYAARGFTLNIGLWYQQSREKLIAKIFSVSGMIPVIRDTVGFKVLTRVPQLILEEDLIQPDSFSIAQAGYTRTQTDSGYVTWQIGTEPVSQVNKSVVACKTTMVKKSDTTIECDWIQDAVKAQKAGKLALQRSLLKDQIITLTAQAKILQLEPGDMITINPANLGAEGTAYDCLITKMTIHEGLWVDAECTKFSAALDDWDDLSISDIVVSDANTDKAYTPVYQGSGDANGDGSNEIKNGAVLIGNNWEYKTNIDPATNGGFVVTNTRLTCYDNLGQIQFLTIFGDVNDDNVTYIQNYPDNKALEQAIMKMNFQSISWAQFCVFESFDDSTQRASPDPSTYDARVIYSHIDNGGDATASRSFGFVSKTYTNITTTETGTSTSIGLNFLTDTAKSWFTDEAKNLTLVDSALSEFTVSANNSNTLTISGTPTAGAYSLKDDNPSYAVAFCTYLDSTNGGYGYVKLEVSFDGGAHYQTFLNTETSVDKLESTQSIDNPGNDYIVRATLKNDGAGKGAIMFKFLICTDPSPWRW